MPMFVIRNRQQGERVRWARSDLLCFYFTDNRSEMKLAIKVNDWINGKRYKLIETCTQMDCFELAAAQCLHLYSPLDSPACRIILPNHGQFFAELLPEPDIEIDKWMHCLHLLLHFLQRKWLAKFRKFPIASFCCLCPFQISSANPYHAGSLTFSCFLSIYLELLSSVGKNCFLHLYIT